MRQNSPNSGTSIMVCAPFLLVIVIGISMSVQPLEPGPAGSASTEEQFIDSFDDPEGIISSYAAGVEFDAIFGREEYFRLTPEVRPAVPEPTLSMNDPRVVVSLAGLTCRLYDVEGEVEKVYPVGVGVRRRSNGKSITPVGRFRTHSDRQNGWFYIWSRWVPKYFDGLPFLRIDARDVDGTAAFGLHGPITTPLKRGYVSHGCVRMRAHDIKELFSVVYWTSPGATVEIQEDYDYTRFGFRCDAQLGRYHPEEAKAADVRLRPGADLRLDVALPEETFQGVPFEISSRCLGIDSSRARYLLYNDGARWDGNLLGPVSIGGATHTLVFESAGPHTVHVVALDEHKRPIGHGQGTITVK